MANWRIIAAGGVAAAVALLGAVMLLNDRMPSAIEDAADCGNAAALVNSDPVRVLGACRRQADRGDAVAQVALGKMYADGRGVPEDFATAQQWFRQAAKKGNADGEYDLGLMYADGDGVGQDYAEAARWYRLASDQGQPDAQNSLGMRYKRGQGVAQDYVQAYKWFALSATLAPSLEGRARAEANRDKVAATMTPSQIAEAQQLVQEWKPAKP
jgi:TPR repeat protein